MRTLPILTFHAIDGVGDVLAFSPEAFTRAFSVWHEAGWRTIALYDALIAMREHRVLPARTFVITFDDGYASVYDRAFPLLKQYDMTATVFVVPPRRAGGQSRQLYERNLLSWEQIHEMHAQGISFGAHTLTHPDLTKLDAARAEHEIRESQSVLADTLGAPVTLFCYPFGKFNPAVREIVARWFAGACSDRLGLVKPKSDVFALERVEMFYLRDGWAARALTQSWFPWYLAARNVPRRMRRLGR